MRLDHARARAGTMQILWEIPCTDADYVIRKLWLEATLEHCPACQSPECRPSRLGTYPRVEPSGTRVPRFWCATKGTSISLLPGFLAARLVGTLAEVERVVTAVEEAGSVEGAVESVLPGDAAEAVGLVCALRWIRRRVLGVRTALVALRTLLPEALPLAEPTLRAAREVTGTGPVLETLRRMGLQWLQALPVPLGFRARAPT